MLTFSSCAERRFATFTVPNQIPCKLWNHWTTELRNLKCIGLLLYNVHPLIKVATFTAKIKETKDCYNFIRKKGNTYSETLTLFHWATWYTGYLERSHGSFEIKIQHKGPDRWKSRYFYFKIFRLESIPTLAALFENKTSIVFHTMNR